MTIALTEADHDVLTRLHDGPLKLGRECPVLSAIRLKMAGLAEISSGVPQTVKITKAGKGFSWRVVE